MTDPFYGEGTEAVEAARRLLGRLSDGRLLRWSTLHRFAPRGGDALDAERLAARLERAGWVAIQRRRARDGDPVPQSLALADGARDAVRAWLGPEAAPKAGRADRLVDALRTWLAEGHEPPIPARVLAQLAAGTTKSVRPREHCAAIEAAFGRDYDALVSEHATAVLTTGPVSWRFGDYHVDARAFEPWVAIPEPVLTQMTDLRLGARVLVTVENQTPFEALAAETGEEPRILVYTGGFPGRAVRAWIRRLVESGEIAEVRHWGDLDPGGLRIFDDVAALVAQASPACALTATVAWRMEAALLEHPAAVPLTSEDRRALEQRLESGTRPLAEVAEAMLQCGMKLEQEALLSG
ncbi:MAG: DUF2220 family protein [Myxococcota bacterium]